MRANVPLLEQTMSMYICGEDLVCLCGYQNIHTFNFIAQTGAPRTPLCIDNLTNYQLINPSSKNLILIKYFSNSKLFIFW